MIWSLMAMTSFGSPMTSHQVEPATDIAHA